MNRAPAAIALSLLTLWCGCSSWPVRSRRAVGSPEQDELAEQVARLKAGNAALRSEQALLQSRVKELLAREQLLSNEVNRLRFMNAQQQKQIRALAQAPADRDRYQAQAEKLTLEAARLRKEVQTLRRTIAALRTGQAGPATAPAEP